MAENSLWEQADLDSIPGRDAQQPRELEATLAFPRVSVWELEHRRLRGLPEQVHAARDARGLPFPMFSRQQSAGQKVRAQRALEVGLSVKSHLVSRCHRLRTSDMFKVTSQLLVN